MRIWPALALTVLVSNSPTIASDQNVFVLAGRFQDEWVWDTAVFWKDHYEENYFFGLGYQNFLLHTDWGLRAGVEVGAGFRAGKFTSTEAWAGIVARYDGFQIGNVAISPAITAGLSLVSSAIGVEAERAAALGTDVPVLFYLGPEIAFSVGDSPSFELVTRIQHRSGGYGVIEHIDGSNAATFGLRVKLN